MTLCACRGAEIEALPSEIVFGAFVDLGPAAKAGTPIRRVDLERPTFPTEDHTFIGWTGDAIRSLSPPDDRIGTDEVAPSRPCQRRLPAPAITLHRIDGEIRPGDPESIPGLTAQWLASSCAPFETAGVAVDSTCQRGRCVPDRISPIGCCLELRLPACGLGTLLLSSASGATVIEGGPPGLDCEPRDLGSSLFSLTCTEPSICEVSVFGVEPPLDLSVERIPLYPSVPPFDPTPAEETDLEPEHIGRGYAGDLLVMDDRALVVGWGGSPVATECDEMSPRPELVEVDLDLFTVVATATLPPCLERIAQDPLGRGFFGVFGAPEAWTLGLFDPGGRLLDAAPFADPLPESRPFGVAAVRSPPRIAVLITSEIEVRETVILAFDAATLGSAGASEPLDIHPWFIEPGPDGDILISDDENNTLARYSLDAHQIVAGLAIGGSADLMRPLWIEELDIALLPSAGAFGAVHRFSPAIDDEGSRSFFRFDLDPIALAPLGDGRVLVAGAERRTRTAHVTLLDPDGPRFSSRSLEIGFGPAARAIPDGRGHILLLMSWTGELLRL
jgi:hypothetical protein